MPERLATLRRIAAAIGYQIVEATDAPENYFLVRHLDDNSSIIARVTIEILGRAKYTLDDLAEALAVAIDHLLSVMMADVTKHAYDSTTIVGEEQLSQLADAAGLTLDTESAGQLSKQDILDLADKLNRFTLSLRQRKDRSS